MIIAPLHAHVDVGMGRERGREQLLVEEVVGCALRHQDLRDLGARINEAVELNSRVPRAPCGLVRPEVACKPSFPPRAVGGVADRRERA